MGGIEVGGRGVGNRIEEPPGGGRQRDLAGAGGVVRIDSHPPGIGGAREPGPGLGVVDDVRGQRLHHVGVGGEGVEGRGCREVRRRMWRRGVQGLELRVRGHVERVGPQHRARGVPHRRGIALLQAARRRIRLGEELRQEPRVQVQAGHLVPGAVVHGKGDGKPGHRHRGLDDRRGVGVRRRRAGERRLDVARRDLVARRLEVLQVLRQQVARQGFADLHVLEGEQLVVGAEVRAPLRRGLGQQFGAVDLDATVLAGRGAGVANRREVERDGDAVSPVGRGPPEDPADRIIAAGAVRTGHEMARLGAICSGKRGDVDGRRRRIRRVAQRRGGGPVLGGKAEGRRVTADAHDGDRNQRAGHGVRAAQRCVLV